MNGMQREIEGSVFIFPMILRIRTVRPERLNWLNSVMPRQISVQLSSTIRLDMILRIKNHSFMKPILEVLTTYHSLGPCLVKSLGMAIKKIGFILDRGYFSRGNIRYLDECGYSFVIMAKGMSSFISDLILENKGTFENKRSCDMNAYGVYGKTVQRTLFEGDEKKRYIHIYHSISKDADEREHFENALRERTALLMSHQNETVEFGSAYEKYFYLHYDKDGVFLYPEEKTTVTEREISLCGYFVIITSERMTAKEALHLYKSRDVSEKFFLPLINHSLETRACVHIQTKELREGFLHNSSH